ncbi:class F sortase [Rhodococcus hoagii]|nr:class F sortase [Prescottella equi]NKR86944.1 class F sortase [Prescottella equi]NKR97712.1 class F sortase [Prescottella equi]NKS09178.1 class F sortase [Prescottella equi]NKS92594.1 class F sortase [Prescottella equi]
MAFMGRHEATRRAGRGGTILMVVVALVLLAGGGFLIFRGLQPEPAAAAPVPRSTFELPPDGVADPVEGALPGIGAGGQARKPGPAAENPSDRPQVPAGPLPDNSVVIPAIGVQTTLDPLGLAPDQSLLLPRDVSQVTYWTGSAPIDAPDGGILVAGHVDNANQGEGALYWMHTLYPGDAVYVTKDGVVTRWKITKMERFVKQALPDWAFQGPGGPRELHVVTCGGEIVKDAQGRGTYLENVVVTAVPF